jgi:Disulphide bond corrector protein DsbC.
LELETSMTRKPLGLLILTFALFVPPTIYSLPIPQSSDDVKTSGSLKPDKVKKGKSAQATILVEIPPGLHLQSSKPLDKFLVPTKLEVETPAGMKVGSVLYPRAVIRQLKFSKSPVSVYEGKVLIHVNVTVPSNYSGGSGDIKGKLRFQACNDDSCFPPVTREVNISINVE